MHISDGVLPLGLVIGGGAGAVGLAALTLPRLTDAQVPKTAVMTAAFFVASLLAFPIGGTSVHLTLAGLMGAMLGAAAFPAVLVGVVLQAALLGHGGVTTIGVNAVVMGVGALVAGWVFARAVRTAKDPSGIAPGAPARAARWAAVGAALGTLVSLLLYAGALLASGSALRDVARLALVLNLPVVVLEALVAGAAVGFIARVEPRLLGGAGRPGAAALALAAVLLLPAAAHAHGVQLEAKVDGPLLVVEAWFTDGTPFAGAQVTVETLGPKGSPSPVTSLGGVLGTDGVWKTRLPAGADRIRVIVQDQAGHRAESHLNRNLEQARRRWATNGAPGGGSDGHGGRSNAMMIGRLVAGFAVIVALALVLHAVQRRRRARQQRPSPDTAGEDG